MNRKRTKTSTISGRLSKVGFDEIVQLRDHLEKLVSKKQALEAEMSKGTVGERVFDLILSSGIPLHNLGFRLADGVELKPSESYKAPEPKEAPITVDFGDLQAMSSQELQDLLREVIREERKERLKRAVEYRSLIWTQIKKSNLSPEDIGLVVIDKRYLNRVTYRDPETGNEWTGHGKIPLWLRQRISEGRSKNDFLINQA